MKTTRCLLVLFAMLTTSLAQAQDLLSERPATDRQTPPQATDEVFSNGSGGDYDLYLFRSDRPNGSMLPFTINRYYGDALEFDGSGFLTNAQDLFDRGLLPPTCTLTMRIYDVDHATPPYPEVDYLYMNGNLITDEYGDPVTLQSGNNIWSTWSCQFPTEFLKFPQQQGSVTTKPTASNVVTISIDQWDVGWAVECDWVAVTLVSPVRPFVLVHGFQGSPGAWSTFTEYLDDDGLPYYLPAANELGPVASIAGNAAAINTIVDGSLNRFGVDRVNIVAHSKGGLDTRMYIRSSGSSKVESFTQLATPNHGSTWADGLNRLPPFMTQSRQPALSQLTTYYIEQNFNYNYQFVTNPPERIGSACTEGSFNRTFIIGANFDLVVLPHNSYTLPWNCYPDSYDDGSIQCSINDGMVNALHITITGSESAYNHMLELIAPSFPTISSDIYVDQGVYNHRYDRTEQLTQAHFQVLTVPAGSGASYQIEVQEEEFARFNMITLDDVYYATLVAPDGTTYDYNSPEYVHDFSELGYFSYFDIVNPMNGTWNVIVASLFSDIHVYVETLIETSRSLTLNQHLYAYPVNQNFPLTAQFTESGIAIIGGQVTGHLSGVGAETDLVFLDNGVAPDQVAEDGIYSAQYPGSPTSGIAVVQVRGETAGDVIYKYFNVTITPVSAHFTNVYSSSVHDTNADGLYNELRVVVQMNVLQAGNFMINGSLRDAAGELISIASASSAANLDFGPGLHTLTLVFSGEDIFTHQVNGPYYLSNLSLIDLGSGFQVDYIDEAYTTSAYNFTQFQHPSVILTGINSENVVDTNGNGQYDYLDIYIGINLLNSGNYTRSAQLLGGNGVSVAWAQASGNLPAGNNNVLFRFNGRDINEAGIDGPYTLTNLSIYSGNNNGQFSNVYITQPYSYGQFEGYFVHGTVVDAMTLLPIDDVVVNLTGSTNMTVVTNPTGVFHFGGLNSGNFMVDASHNVYGTIPGVMVSVPPDTTMTLHMDCSGFCDGPVIVRTPTTMALHDQAWPVGSALTIEVEITDDVSPLLQSARLFYRTIGETTWGSVAMDLVRSDIFAADIDPSYALMPGIEYYVTATDGLVIGADPAVDPVHNPYQISITDITIDGQDLPVDLALESAYPNPFNPSTVIPFVIDQTRMVELSVYNVTGQRVAVLEHGLFEKGRHFSTFDGSRLSSGVYIVVMESQQALHSRKILLVR